MRGAIAGGAHARGACRRRCPAGAARNALDCALWDLEAKQAGRPAWALAGLEAPAPCITAVTLSLDTPERMGAAAACHAHLPLLKLKVTGEGDADRIRAVRANAPAARLIVDANEGWTPPMLDDLLPALAALGVEMVEQPLPAADDDALEGRRLALPLCADESCHTRADLPRLAGRYPMVNIKLDKTGGLTEALALAAEAKEPWASASWWARWSRPRSPWRRRRCSRDTPTTSTSTARCCWPATASPDSATTGR